MSFQIVSVLLSLALIAASLYRRKLLQTPPNHDTFTAASITSIEAAFIRDGSAGLVEFGHAAETCGETVSGSIDPAVVGPVLVARGLVYEPQVAAALSRLRTKLCGLLAVLILLAATGAHFESRTAVRQEDGGTIALSIVAALAIFAITRGGGGTPAGRRALAVRRAAFPVRLLAPADPVEAVALYGGAVRRRHGGRVAAYAHGDGGGDFVWVSADGGSGDGGHGHSHSCGHSCGASCGGH